MTTMAYRYQVDHWLKRLLLKPIFWILLIVFFFAYPITRSVFRQLPPQLPAYFEVPAYTLMDENGQPFGSKDLEGKAYIASFAFTSCPSTCPALFEKLSKMQKRLRGVGNKVKLVTYTVDPENDTSEVLFQKARELKANPYLWRFLTGDLDAMKSLVVKGFKVPMSDSYEREFKVDNRTVTMFDIAHTEKFVLVDHQGTIRGFYSSDKEGINKLMIDVGLLINRFHFQGSGDKNVRG